MDTILQLPNPPQDRRIYFLGYWSATSWQSSLTALSKNCPWLKELLLPKSFSLHPITSWSDMRVWSSDSLIWILKGHPSSRALVEFAEHLFGMLPQTSLSLCPIRTPFLPLTCWYWEHFSGNSVHVSLYLRICFVRNPTSKSRRYWTTCSFICE